MKTGTRLSEYLRVLIVDDHPLTRDGIASLLTANNIEVVGEASDGLEAFDKARQLKPNIILMDINMPRCNGLEATCLIKAEMPQIKIVIITACDDDDYRFEAIRSGAEDYLLKTFRAEELLTVLSAAVNAPVNAQERLK